MQCAVILSLLAVSVFAERVFYDDYKVYRVVPTTKEHLSLLRKLEGSSNEYDFWSEPQQVDRRVDVMVSPNKQAEFESLLKSSGIEHRPFIDDVQSLIDLESSRIEQKAFDWSTYHRLDTIYAWLDELIQSNPAVTGVVAGSTYEGREIRGVKVSFKPGNRIVFVEAGIHAREWIGPATATYILNELLNSTDPNVRDVAENFDWYFVPVANPDGYEYTHTTDRKWRKTRAPYAISTGFVCYGVDPNRNWPFHWNASNGFSSDPCSGNYAGPSPWSEPETRSLGHFVSGLAADIDIYLSLHSYSQLLLVPYSFTNETRPANFDDLMYVAEKAVAKLSERFGTVYEAGNTVEVLYAAYGTSFDWAMGGANISFSYTYELRDAGDYGFLLPADQIVPSGQETLDSVVELVQQARAFLG